MPYSVATFSAVSGMESTPYCASIREFTKRHPIVYGEWLGAPGSPTILVYGHYDVQPVDPVDELEQSLELACVADVDLQPAPDLHLPTGDRTVRLAESVQRPEGDERSE